VLNHRFVVQYLLSRGSCFGRALHFAAATGATGAIQALLDEGANANVAVDGWTAVERAIQHGHGAAALLLLQKSPDYVIRRPLSAAVVKTCGLPAHSSLCMLAAKFGANAVIKHVLLVAPEWNLLVTNNTVNAGLAPVSAHAVCINMLYDG
jgi:ankyrin repeat protein